MATCRTRKRRRLFGEPKVVKLGPLVHTFSLPAIKTCPGRSWLCELLCYATTSFFVMESVSAKHKDNLRRSRTKDFVGDAIAEVRAGYFRLVRIHMAGDFYSLAYLAKWLEIVRGCPRTTFFGYTRSWAVPRFLPRLVELAGLKNMHLWLSADKAMPRPPEIPGMRVAYLLDNGESPADVPAWADLVFRDQEPFPLKRANGVLVCPYEQGIERQVRLTCSQCRICWTPPR